MNEYLTSRQATERLNVMPSRIRRMMLEGLLQAEKAGRDNFISDGEVKRLTSHQRKAGRLSETKVKDEN